MQLKDYQRTTLDAFSRWLETLEKERDESKKGIEALEQAGIDIPDDLRNYPKKTWDLLKESGDVAPSAGDYISRTDDVNRPIPHICFKVPTGGGKTLLATAALERLNRQRGLTLWIVPTKSIYAQTKAALWDRQHPYRLMLERASAGKVKVLEKETPFNRDDIANYLCVMLLMLPAANRKSERSRAFLRMYKDSGRYSSFFPDSDDIQGNAHMQEKYPDLECKTEGGFVKQSLFNVFKKLRPVVVLDEAHKAYGGKTRGDNEEFTETISKLNPQIVIELSATPNKGISNLLVDVGGTDLKKEEMIKLPIQVKAFKGVKWEYTLAQAVDELNRLAASAQAFETGTERYIRPIAVVRVERTGNDKRDGERIHAEDVRDQLKRLNVPAETIRVKSSDNDELGKEDLLSTESQVRWIITKSALMEGWDCPFAYLLVMLDNTQAQKAITQLVGRVMRQPHAQRTKENTLDQCYVYCNNTDVGVAVEKVKTGLEEEGLTGLGDEVMSTGGTQTDFSTIVVERRDKFREKSIYLPRVLHKEGNEYVQLSYQEHILPNIDWESIQPPDPNASAAISPILEGAAVDVEEAPPVYHEKQKLDIDKTLNVSDFARRLSDLLPNPWQAARITSQMYKNLRQNGKTDEDIYDRRSYLVHVLREHIKRNVEKQAKKSFHRKLNQGEIRFDLETGKPNYTIRDVYEISVPDNASLLAKRGNVAQLTLFEKVFEQQFDNEFEKKFAFYLDEQKTLQWWHRVAAKQSGEYYVQGWKPERIYPDFVAMANEYNGVARVLLFDTKGKHLEGNLDTKYKQKVLKTLENAFNDVGKMTVRKSPQWKGIFRLVFDSHEFDEISEELKECTERK